jgi:PAS domain S-box-containing protein
VAETWFEEMKRYVRFDDDDQAVLRGFANQARPHFPRIVTEFYGRLAEHDEARRVFSGPEQVERLKGSLSDWLDLLLKGPWDEDYYQKRARIGRMHVKIGLPQRYMFGAMNLVRIDLKKVAQEIFADAAETRNRLVRAISKILDLELAIMLETYGEAYLDKVQRLERLERSLLEQKLAISEARYGEIVEKSEALIATADAAGHIELFNRRAQVVTGLSAAQAQGRSWLDVFARTDDREALGALHDRALKGERAPATEVVFSAADGHERRIRWLFTTLPGSNGPILCSMGLDVTEEHELTLRSTRAERLAALGTMAAGLAHEIRNPLNAAHLQLAVLQRRLARTDGADVSGAQGAADLAANEIKRLARLVDEFLQFARPQPLRPAPGDLRSTAQVVIELLGPEAHSVGVELTLQTSKEPVAIEYDDERIKQVLLNLVRNALEATGRGGRVRVGVEAADGGARVEVEDDGRGLANANAPIFEPFYTTKETGTGLGLAIVHRIVTHHGGRIGVESRPGRTLFSIWLPPHN